MGKVFDCLKPRYKPSLQTQVYFVTMSHNCLIVFSAP